MNAAVYFVHSAAVSIGGHCHCLREAFAVSARLAYRVAVRCCKSSQKFSADAMQAWKLS